MEIKVYSNRILSGPFEYGYGRRILKRHGITVVSDPRDSDLIVSDRKKSALRNVMRFPWKRHLLWSTEPYLFNGKTSAISSAPFPRIYRLNLLTGAFRTNYFWLPDLPPISEVKARQRGRKSKVAIFMHFSHPYKAKVKIFDNATRIDLHEYRQDFGVQMHALGMADIYGDGWPNQVALPPTTKSGVYWRTTKIEVLRNYEFGSALENLTAPHYVTEKIWDPIAAQSLPLYFGRGGTIFDSFPKDSFIDTSEFSSFEDCRYALRNLSDADYLMRLNACISVLNRKMAEVKTQTPPSDSELSEMMVHLNEPRKIEGFALSAAKEILRIFEDERHEEVRFPGGD